MSQVKTKTKVTTWALWSASAIGECGWTQEGEKQLYFAWRAYYADTLLKELDK